MSCNDILSQLSKPMPVLERLETDIPVLQADSPLQHMFVDEQFKILQRYIQNYETPLIHSTKLVL